MRQKLLEHCQWVAYKISMSSCYCNSRFQFRMLWNASSVGFVGFKWSVVTNRFEIHLECFRNYCLLRTGVNTCASEPSGDRENVVVDGVNFVMFGTRVVNVGFVHWHTSYVGNEHLLKNHQIFSCTVFVLLFNIASFKLDSWMGENNMYCVSSVGI